MFKRKKVYFHKPKAKDGLGLKMIDDMNRVMFAMTSWRIVPRMKGCGVKCLKRNIFSIIPF